MIDTDKLRALDEAPGLQSVDAVKHYLYARRASILAMAEENARMREALERITQADQHQTLMGPMYDGSCAGTDGM